MSNKMDVHFSSLSNEWETPKATFQEYDDLFHFGLDAAATAENELCPRFYSQDSDALQQDWSGHGNVWLNPPYGRILGKFIRKAYEESLKGMAVVCLIPSRTDTKAYHDYCLKYGRIRFFRGRLKFDNRCLPSWRADGSHKRVPAPFPSCIVIFNGSPEMLDILKQSGKLHI